MGPDVDARQLIEAVWSDYARDPTFNSLRSWMDPEAGTVRFVPGEGSMRPWVTFIGEAPGADENRMGRPFVGQSGQLIRSLIAEELKLNPADCWITNVVKYRPLNNATPNVRDQINSWPYLRRELECLAPRAKVVVPLGAVAWSVFDSSMSISSVEGTMRMGKNGWLIVPMFHPSFIGRNPKQRLPQYRKRFAVIREAIDTPE